MVSTSSSSDDESDICNTSSSSEVEVEVGSLSWGWKARKYEILAWESCTKSEQSSHILQTQYTTGLPVAADETVASIIANRTSSFLFIVDMSICYGVYCFVVFVYRSVILFYLFYFLCLWACLFLFIAKMYLNMSMNKSKSSTITSLASLFEVRWSCFFQCVSVSCSLHVCIRIAT